MAIQILPIIKAVTPYLAQVATAAIPAFTSPRAKDAKSDEVQAAQIEELQQAATQNAQSLHTLAENLQQAMQSIEVSMEVAQRQVATYKMIVVTSLILSLISTAGCIFLLATRTV